MSQVFESESAVDHFVFVQEICEQYGIKPIAVNIDTKQDKPVLLTLDFDDFLELCNRRELTVDGQELYGNQARYRADLYEVALKAAGPVSDDFLFIDWD